MTLNDSKPVSSGQNITRAGWSDDCRREEDSSGLRAPLRSQGAALQFQVHLHLLFLHDFLQFCRSPGVLEEGESETVTNTSVNRLGYSLSCMVFSSADAQHS